ncbi:MAG: leucine-rich repeat protein [Clostridia bacterium]|nr:leucine-rich repeat protein [Clostridia bacterium]
MKSKHGLLKLFVIVFLCMSVALCFVGCSTKYTITFETEIGVQVESMKVKEGTMPSELPVPEKDGYKFEYWMSKNQKGYFEKWQPKALYEDLTLYAKWSKDDGNFYWEDTADGNFYWEDTADGNIKVVGYYGQSSNVVIPAKIAGKTVVEIGDYFCLRKSISSVVIPDGVKTIGQSAFQECTSLTSASLPASLETISKQAFNSCNNLSVITLPKNVKEVGASAFANSGLQSVTFAEESKLKKIDEFVFYGCKNLQQITLPASIESIGESALANCNNLEKIIFADNSNLKSIGRNIVKDSDKLHSVYITDISAWASVDFEDVTANPLGAHTRWSTLYYQQGIDLYINDTKCISLQIPKELKIIKKYAFCHSTIQNVTFEQGSQLETIERHAFVSSDLQSISLPASLRTIDQDAFRVTPHLEHVSFEQNGLLQNIGTAAFYDSALKDFVLPDSVTTIEESAFYNCRDLKSFVIGKDSNLQEVKAGAFSGCNSIEIYVSDLAKWCSISFRNINEVLYASSIKLFVGGEELVHLQIPEGTETLGDYLFAGCTSIQSITFPSTLTSIGQYAFWNCPNLTQINFAANNNLKTLPLGIFSSCNALTKVDMHDSVEEISEYAFSNCQELKGVTFGANSQLKVIGNRAFIGCKKLESVYIPSKVQQIGEYAFYYDEALKEVIFDANSQCQVVKKYAFSYTTNLKKVSLPDSIVTLEWNAFAYSGVEEVSFGQNSKLKSIYSGCFDYCQSLTSIKFPPNVENIGTYRECISLKTFCIPAKVQVIGDMYYNMFYRCTSLKTVTAEQGSQVYKIGDFAFNSCFALESVEFPDSLTEIGQDAFFNCTSLKNVTLPQGVQTLGDNVFQDCVNLERVVIPQSVTYVGWNIFRNCNYVTAYCEATSQPAGWEEGWCHKDCPVYWYSETQPTTSGNWWHYVDGVVTVWPAVS